MQQNKLSTFPSLQIVPNTDKSARRVQNGPPQSNNSRTPPPHSEASLTSPTMTSPAPQPKIRHSISLLTSQETHR